MKEPEILKLEGEIDLHRTTELREQLQPLLKAKRPEILLDLAQVSYMDSSGLAVLIEAFQATKSYGGNLAICGLQPRVRSIIDIARLDQILTVYESVQEAAGSRNR